MLERVIENWLTSVPERDFTVAFCQLLALKGFRVVHVSPQGPFELYPGPGFYNVPKAKFAKLLMSVLPLEVQGEPLSAKKVQRAAASALLLASYLLMTYEREKNHWAAAEGWTMTTAHLLSVAEK